MTDPAFDLIIRGGRVATATAVFEADVAISGGRITEVGKVSARGREEIDAKGKLVAPGFVDVHTHYDGQVTWSQDITPSSQNGVTTAIMGNCGVGFAPCRPDDHLRLIQLMEGVEDIPEPVLSAGIPWSWESFPDYMNWLSKRNFDIAILPPPRTTRRWRSLRAKRCAPARLASQPRARSTIVPRPAISRRRSRPAKTN